VNKSDPNGHNFLSSFFGVDKPASDKSSSGSGSGSDSKPKTEKPKTEKSAADANKEALKKEELKEKKQCKEGCAKPVAWFINDVDGDGIPDGGGEIVAKPFAGGLWGGGCGLPCGKNSDFVSPQKGVPGLSNQKPAPKAPDFEVAPNGTVLPVPKGATGPSPVVNPSGKTTGSAFTGGSGGNGMSPNTNTLRMMDPTPPRGSSPGYPNGYGAYSNSAGQGVNPYTGRTIPNSDPNRHIPF
jgi:hypothetical protein